MKKYIAEVWYHNKMISPPDEFVPRETAREAYEDAVDWAASNTRNPEQATCYGVNEKALTQITHHVCPILRNPSETQIR